MPTVFLVAPKKVWIGVDALTQTQVREEKDAIVLFVAKQDGMSLNDDDTSDWAGMCG